MQVDRPRLPVGIDRLVVQALPVGTQLVDLCFQRDGDAIKVSSPDAERDARLLEVHR